MVDLGVMGDREMTTGDHFHVQVEYPPTATARPRSFVRGGRICVYDKQHKQRNDFTKLLIAAVKLKYGSFPKLEGAVELNLIFHVARSTSHYGTGKNQDTVKQSAPAYPSVSDIDNYCKFVMDCMNKRAFTDDRQVVRLVAEKRFSKEPMIEIGWKNCQDKGID